MDQEEIANLTLEYLKRFDARFDRLEEDIRDMKFRLRQVEEKLRQVEDNLSHHTSRFDRIDDRLLKIEKRVDLVDA